MINLWVCPLTHWNSARLAQVLVSPCSLTVLPSPFSLKTLWKQGSVFKHVSARFNGIFWTRRDGAEERKVLQNTTARWWSEQERMFMCSARVCVCFLLMWKTACPTSCERLDIPPPRAVLLVVLSCPVIYSDFVMLFTFLHVTYAFSQGHMEREQDWEGEVWL